MNQKLINKPIITSEDLEQLGIPPTQAKRVVHDAKKKQFQQALPFIMVSKILHHLNLFVKL